MQIAAEIPDELVPLIASAFAELYPTLTANKKPTKAIEAVIKSWTREIVVAYVERKTRQQADVMIAEAERARDLAIQKKMEEVRIATEFLVTEPTPPATPVPTEPVDPPKEPEAPIQEEGGEVNGSDTI